jgi:hypothetical protein
VSPDGNTWSESVGETGIAVPTGTSAVYITGAPSGTNALVWSARYHGRYDNYGYNLAASASQIFLIGASAWGYPHLDAMTTVTYPAA